MRSLAAWAFVLLFYGGVLTANPCASDIANSVPEKIYPSVIEQGLDILNRAVSALEATMPGSDVVETRENPTTAIHPLHFNHFLDVDSGDEGGSYRRNARATLARLYALEDSFAGVEGAAPRPGKICISPAVLPAVYNENYRRETRFGLKEWLGWTAMPVLTLGIGLPALFAGACYSLGAGHDLVEWSSLLTIGGFGAKVGAVLGSVPAPFIARKLERDRSQTQLARKYPWLVRMRDNRSKMAPRPALEYLTVSDDSFLSEVIELQTPGRLPEYLFLSSPRPR